LLPLSNEFEHVGTKAIFSSLVIASFMIQNYVQSCFTTFTNLLKS
jgi:hypothetical protein